MGRDPFDHAEDAPDGIAHDDVLHAVKDNLFLNTLKLRAPISPKERVVKPDKWRSDGLGYKLFSYKLFS